MTQSPHAALAAEIRRIAVIAGAEIMTRYAGVVTARAKADSSPVTDADEAAERIILDALAKIDPESPVVAEESVAAGRTPEVAGRTFWLVDPLDGTKEFLSRNGEFTVNIARIEEGRPVLGVVHAPAVGQTYFAYDGQAFAVYGDGPPTPIHVRPAPAEGLVCVVSRSHRTPETDAFLKGLAIAEERSAGSSLKFCLVAAGEADIYPRLGRTMEWDTAAGHAVVAAAGGSVRRLDGRALDYGKPGFENPPFVVRGGEG